MGWILALIGASGLAALLGYFIRPWRLLPMILVSGVVVIVIDVSTRDLTTGGHDDRGLVAFAEVILLLVFVALPPSASRSAGDAALGTRGAENQPGISA